MTDNLEHRMFLGRVVTTDDFSSDKSLVQVGVFGIDTIYPVILLIRMERITRS
ncbi:hypothetical protein AKUH4B205J_01640 [Apilactobacillus kunkeei]|nr:hypothetical protein AKUH4B205J_01640 [Apilactobacillus kunkeei]